VHAPPAPKGAELALPWPNASAPRFSASAHEASPTLKDEPKGARISGGRAPMIEASPRTDRKSGSLLPELSSVVNSSRLSGEESLKRERLASKVAAMRKLDYFEILGVPTSASREEVKRAYFALAKEYHPDKHFGSSSAEVRQLAQQLYDLISSAHDTLTDPVERDRYLKEVAAGVKREMGEDVGKILAAEGKFQKGEELMRQRNYAGAHAHFKEAIDLYGDEGEFHAWLGWADFHLNPTETKAIDGAVAHIETAISLNPKIDKPYLFLGYIYKATGRPDKAEKLFEKAIQANPDCTEALRELRLLGKSRK
jgi:curved DNA-binding protein CbpA